jgi:hypothetical protein
MLLVWSLGWVCHRILGEELLGKCHLEDQENERMILRWVLGK